VAVAVAAAADVRELNAAPALEVIEDKAEAALVAFATPDVVEPLAVELELVAV